MTAAELATWARRNGVSYGRAVATLEPPGKPRTEPAPAQKKTGAVCLSCGAPIELPKRKYCSSRCRRVDRYARDWKKEL